ncbi:ROK family transcriptional regulator [Arthrobacter sp. Soil782]|uniref:ROK family transcriptional regulator n=1 Tax=Arthrobacter sp. Soil782 TaxID=1736410 RepID=UPI0012F80B9D|nr:ROK family protein [Arthrobacter sp. Soil782]
MNVNHRGGSLATGASSTTMLRRSNARLILDAIRRAPSGDSVTANELIGATSLTRATVLGVCDDLLRDGWIREQPALAATGKGRPARHFALDDNAGYVLGIDAGYSHIRSVVANLRGEVVGRGGAAFTADIDNADPAPRTAALQLAIESALGDGGIAPSRVLTVCFGIPAPVGRHGTIPTGNPFWERMAVDQEAVLAGRPQWTSFIENDANLAALAERYNGTVDPDGSFLVLLAGERFGAGVIEDGHLLHGSLGGGGEMHYLDLVEGVGSPAAIAPLARAWATEALVAGRTTILSGGPSRKNGPSAEAVFAAAEAGDAVAIEIVERLAERLSRVISTLASLLNPDTVVIGGAVAPSIARLAEQIEAKVATTSHFPPRVVASSLAGDIVLTGAVNAALARVSRDAMDIELRRA